MRHEWFPIRKLARKRRGKLQRQRHQLRPPGDVYLAEDTADVGLDRLFADAEPFGDLPVHEPLGDENDDFTLLPAEAFIRS